MDNHKRPLNAYLLFCEERRGRLLAEEPDLNHKTIMQRLGELWNSFSDEQKKPYKEKAQKLQEEFHRQNPEYHYKQKKPKQKQTVSTIKFTGGENILPVDPNFLMALGFQTLLQSANQTHLLNLPQFQPSAPVSMPPPPVGKSNGRTATIMAMQIKQNMNKGAEVISMPPPPGFSKSPISISMPPPPPPLDPSFPSMRPPPLLSNEDQQTENPTTRRFNGMPLLHIQSMPPPVQMPPPPSSSIPKMPPPPPIAMPPPPSIVPKMPPPPSSWN